MNITQTKFTPSGVTEFGAAIGPGDDPVGDEGVQGSVRRPAPVLSGAETDEELRAMAFHFMAACPLSCEENRCPFRVLSRLYHVSSKALINSMGRRGLASLFGSDFGGEQCRLEAVPATEVTS